MSLNLAGIAAIYRFEMERTFRTIAQSIATPVISTALYFVVFGAAIGSRMAPVDGIPYGAYIVPGLILLSIMTESVANASFGIYLPKFTGTIGEILSAPLSPSEMVLGYVGAAVTKSLMVGAVTLCVARLCVPFTILHPFAMIGLFVLIALAFSLFGFILGLLANSFEQLQIVPLLILNPLGFLAGTFYSLKMLPEPWGTIALFNPLVYLVSGFRWTFHGVADVGIGTSIGLILAFLAVCSLIVGWIVRTGYRLKG
ncbi:MAG: ABC transporter permease [Sphingomonas fennica]